eukprot:Skav214744  [mRNA]  locus=scaffold983:96789:97770:- [translate_table: standard]
MLISEFQFTDGLIFVWCSVQQLLFKALQEIRRNNSSLLTALRPLTRHHINEQCQLSTLLFRHEFVTVTCSTCSILLQLLLTSHLDLSTCYTAQPLGARVTGDPLLSARRGEVVDSSDRERVEEAHEELMKMLSKDEMKAGPRGREPGGPGGHGKGLGRACDQWMNGWGWS